LYGYAELDTIVNVDSTIYIYSGQEIRGLGIAELKFVSGLTKCIQVEGGAAKITGVLIRGTKNYDYSSSTQINSQANITALNGIGNEIGILVDSVNYTKIDNCHFVGLDRGISGSYNPQSLSNIANCSFLDCYVGLDLNTRWEYNSCSNLTAYDCLIACRLIGGNNYVDNFTSRTCRVGFVANSGDNDSHSSLSNSSFNHCGYIGVFLNSIAYQISLNNVQVWATTGDAAVTSVSSSMNWVGGYIDDNVSITGSDVNLISSCFFNAGSTITGTINLKNNWRMDGSTTGVQN
jgi:hypothetical protein